jgi:hypothetical protein
MTPKLTFDDGDGQHAYWLDPSGKAKVGWRCSGVSTLAKMIPETWKLEQWNKRTVAKGMFLDYVDERKLFEKLAVDPDDKTLGDKVASEALNIAKAHDAAERGTQMHKVLELLLLNKPELMYTEQQRRDAQVLQATLDRYDLRLTNDALVEQFVLWPDHSLAGRFDAVLHRGERDIVLVDLKSGLNAILYPQTTAIQLALYARAPLVSAVIDETTPGRRVVEQWREMPVGLDYRRAYVLLCQPDAEIGSLHEIDIEKGWAAAKLSLQGLRWRRENKSTLVREVAFEEPATAVYTMADLASAATTVEELRELWRQAKRTGRHDSAFDLALQQRLAQLQERDAGVMETAQEAAS